MAKRLVLGPHGAMGAKRTAWHFYFCILLRRYGPSSFEVRDEVPLSEEPPRMDYLILRRSAGPSPLDDEAETLRALWPLLPRFAVVELKTIGRPYEKANLDRLWSYAHAYHAAEHRSIGGREHLSAVLIVPSRTPTLDADAAAMGLAWVDLGDGYWRLTGGLFTLHVVEIDVVAAQHDEDLLALYSHSEVRSPRAITFWGELVGPEAKMEMRELEGYEEAIRKILDALPPELRMAGLPPEQRLAGLRPEQRMAGLPPEQRMAGLPPEQTLLALPDEMLKKMPDSLFADLPESVRAAIRARIGRP